MARLSDVSSDVIKALLAGASLVKAILAINAGGAATVKTTGALSFTNNGILYSKAALAAQSMVPTHDCNQRPGSIYVQPINTVVYYTLGVNAAGAVCVVQGSYDGQPQPQDPLLGAVGPVFGANASNVGNGQVPDVPAGYTPFGLIKVATNGVATYNPGTTALDAAGLTVTFLDLCLLPAGRP